MQAERACPLCGVMVAKGADMVSLERHFQKCVKTDDRKAPRREWDDPTARDA